MVPSVPKKLVLVGGGHSHALVLYYWQKQPHRGVELTLISENSTTPYSGMVPGYIAGFYDRSECFIDLAKLCHRSGVNFIKDGVTGLDLENNLVKITDRAIDFDLVSLNIGSTPFVPPSISSSWVIPVKPIGQFLAHWDKIKCLDQPLTIAIVGGGAGGVELAFTIGVQHQHSEIHIFHQGMSLLPGHSQWVQQRALQKLKEKGIKVYLNNEVVEVKNQTLRTRSGQQLTIDFGFWVTQGMGAPWLRSSGLALDDRGFILVNASLRSVSHPLVFAAGDIATMINFPRPKAGVFAVRQGLPLYRNLYRSLTNQPLKTHKPQSNYLSLIGTGDGKAIASWGHLGAEGQGLAWLKDYIDRKFMAQFV